MKRTWKDFAKFLVETYGVMAYIDDPSDDADENVVYCPECGEGVYEEDYPYNGYDGEPYECPICETVFDD